MTELAVIKSDLGLICIVHSITFFFYYFSGRSPKRWPNNAEVSSSSSYGCAIDIQYGLDGTLINVFFVYSIDSYSYSMTAVIPY